MSEHSGQFFSLLDTSPRFFLIFFLLFLKFIFLKFDPFLSKFSYFFLQRFILSSLLESRRSLGLATVCGGVRPLAGGAFFRAAYRLPWQMERIAARPARGRQSHPAPLFTVFYPCSSTRINYGLRAALAGGSP